MKPRDLERLCAYCLQEQVCDGDWGATCSMDGLSFDAAKQQMLAGWNDWLDELRALKPVGDQWGIDPRRHGSTKEERE